MAKSKLILPRVFDNNAGKGHSENDKYLGLPKISYSQLGSWRDPKYRKDYFKNYFAGISLPQGVFAEYGTACGKFMESFGETRDITKAEILPMLSSSDIEILKQIEYPEDSIYEEHIVIYREDLGYIIEGFADRIIYEGNDIIVEDFKTGNLTDKADFYASDDYMQTRLYAYRKIQQGYNLKDCRVLMLGRKGNGSEKHPMRLSGETKYIPTPYDEKKVEEFLKGVDETVKEISEYYQTYLKLCPQHQ